MRVFLFFCIFLCLFAGPAAASVPPETPVRSQALELLVKLRSLGATARALVEYQRVEDLFIAGETAVERGDRELAEGSYRQAVVEARILADRLASPGSGEDEPASPAETLPPEPAPAEEASPSGETSPPALTSEVPPLPVEERSPWLVGGERNYTAASRETLRHVAARLGVKLKALATANGLASDAVLAPGQTIHYNNRRIVPKRLRDGIVINIPDRTLYYFVQGRQARAFPIAVGKPAKTDEEPVWETPTGRFRIRSKAKDPVWRVPQSIQEEMAQKGKPVQERVEPGKENPLGGYALYTTLAGILIHSTNRPGSVNSFSSHGCIRLHPEHMESLFPEVRVNTPGEIVYQPVKVAVTREGKVYLEVHRDVYNRVKDLRLEAERLVAARGGAELVDWDKVDLALRRQAGVAIDVTRSATASRRPAPAGAQLRPSQRQPAS
jgi:lipoprotein-anchoring transpeptidase ErfK/SrfK